MVFFCAFRPTMICLRKAIVTIPKLSPTHTRAKIIKFCLPVVNVTTTTPVEEEEEEEEEEGGGVAVECYDPLFVLECSPDLVTEGYREQTITCDGGKEDICPLMIVESHEEGILRLLEIEISHDDNDDDNSNNKNNNNSKLKLNEWYDVGHILGVIDDGDDDDDDDDENNDEWLWQAYSHSEEKEIMKYSTDGTYTIIKTKKEENIKNIIS
jgi:hypothetical protein